MLHGGLGHTQRGACSSQVLSCIAPRQVAVKHLLRCHLCLPAGMNQGSLLDAAHVIWAVGDPVVCFLHPVPVSPCGLWKAPTTAGQEKALQRVTRTLSLFL